MLMGGATPVFHPQPVHSCSFVRIQFHPILTATQLCQSVPMSTTEEKFLTYDQVRDTYGLSPRYIRKLCTERKLQRFKLLINSKQRAVVLDSEVKKLLDPTPA